MSEKDDDNPLLIHCVAVGQPVHGLGIHHFGAKARRREIEAAKCIRAAAPHAHPNRRIVALADEILGLEGRLIAAREAMGPAEPMIHGPLVRLPLLGGRPR